MSSSRFHSINTPRIHTQSCIPSHTSTEITPALQIKIKHLHDWILNIVRATLWDHSNKRHHHHLNYYMVAAEETNPRQTERKIYQPQGTLAKLIINLKGKKKVKRSGRVWKEKKTLKGKKKAYITRPPEPTAYCQPKHQHRGRDPTVLQQHSSRAPSSIRVLHLKPRHWLCHLVLQMAHGVRHTPLRYIPVDAES